MFSSAAWARTGSSEAVCSTSAWRCLRLRLVAFFQPVELGGQAPDFGIQIFDLLLVSGGLFGKVISPLIQRGEAFERDHLPIA